MQAKNQQKISLNSYHREHENFPVHRMQISDNALGLQLIARLVDANFANCLIQYLKPDTAHAGELPGVYITKLDGAKDLLAVIILTLDGHLEVVSNDEFGAKAFLLSLIFKDLATFDTRTVDLTISGEWTTDRDIRRVFMSAIDNYMPIIGCI